MLQLFRITQCTWTNGLFFVIITCQWCSSDFNVVIPEICSFSENIRLNITWIRETVRMGISEEQQNLNQIQIPLNIFGPEEICDGSEGLLKMISATHSDPSGQMIASLAAHLCPTADTFFHLRQHHFISWTCSKSPGVLSLKPSINDVALGAQRLVKYFNWRRVGFTKSRTDGSPFCNEIGILLRNFYETNSDDNVSIIILENWEETTHLAHPGTTFSPNIIDSVLLCKSYNFVLKNYLFLNTSSLHFGSSSFSFMDKLRRIPIPTVIIPEWPIPLNIFNPLFPSSNSNLAPTTFALVATPRLNSFTPAATAVSSNFPSESPVGNYRDVNENSDKIRLQKIMETLLAHLILRSVKVELEMDRTQWESSSWSPNPNSNSNSHTHTFAHHFNSKLSFYFTVLQYDKRRWHPLINLSSNGERQQTTNTMKSPTQPGIGETFSKRHNHHKNSAHLSPDDDWVTWVQVLIATSAAAVVILALICISLYARKRSRDSMYGSTTRRKLSRRLRSQGPYKVLLTSKDIAFGTIAPTTEMNSKKNTRSQFGSGQSHHGSEERPDLLKGSHGALRKNATVIPPMQVETNLTGEHRGARFKGDLVHLKKIPTFTEPLQVKMKALTVLETLHGLRHENLAAMLGCLTEVSPGLVWEFCSRGSLYDILQQNHIKLDWAFKLSLLTDLVRGMRYLHLSMIRTHGSLNSFNCVVDARWVLKITNYGINGLLQTQGLPSLEQSSSELLWVAPELLRDESLRKYGTQAGDVYSFAIIMQEVLVRGKPYSMLTLTAEEILEKVRRPPPLIRPSVSKGAAPPEAINIMRQCWAELPDMRPDFMVIHDLFKTLNHGRKANIVDTMFQMLEKYSNNLEELIRERTEQLDLERKKTEQLLNRMLPSTVAEKLKMGLPVDPEEFSEVTIYFSDIVGFTTISAYSTPFEVVDLLNDLYTSFDATINDYNVYKVETIGDAYMVVGGAPIWSADHADQIATMALDLLHQSGKFRIRHLPYTPLRLRIGLHTGPCCAGVVGLTMPRYCLFGDTVNTASRMESTGSAWRIHISRETKAKLDSIGGYIIQYRGMTDIKGKGQLETFWLLGKEGFDKELPKPPGPNESVKLDEKSIQYGRTGKMPETENIKGNEFGESIPNAQQNLTIPVKPQLKYCVLTGDNLRCLSPAEQVAYQLLNGKPVARGLRRQFSLDQGANAHPLVSMKSFRKAPSLEDTSEQHQQNAASTSCISPAPLDFSQEIMAHATNTNINTNKNKTQCTKHQIQTQPSTPVPENLSFSHTQESETGNNPDNNSPINTLVTNISSHTPLTRISAPVRTSSTNSSCSGGSTLPVLEESPLLARRGRRLESTSLDT